MPHISPKTQRRLSLLVSIVSLAAVAWWISNQDDAAVPRLRPGLAWLVGAVGVYGVALAVRGFRWHRILRLIHIPHKRADAYRLCWSATWATTCCPCAAARSCASGCSAAHDRAPARDPLSVIAERVLDAAVLAALFAILTWFNVADAPAGQTPAAIAAIVLVLGGVRVRRLPGAAPARLLPRFHEKVGPFLARCGCSRTPRACCWRR